MKTSSNLSKFYPLIIITSGIIIAIIMINLKPVAKPEEITFKSPFVDTKKVTVKATNVTIKSQGTVNPGTESQIFSEIIGPVIFVSSKLEEGASFSKGDTLAMIDPKDYELDIKSAESNLAAAKTKLTFEEAEAKSAKEEWEKIGKGKPSDLTLRVPQLNQAKSAVEAAEASLERLKRNLNKTIITAPYNGLVRKKNIDIGTIVSPGYLLASVYSIDYVEIKLPVPDEDLAFMDIPLDGEEIKVENQSKVHLSGLFGGVEMNWQGRIVRMEAEIDPKSRMAILIARVQHPYDLSIYKIPLRVGQFVQAQIVGKKYNNIVEIDRELIKNNNEIITVNQTDSTLSYQTVTILRYIDDTALISSGLNQNSLLCITNLDLMYDGMKIQLR